MKYLCAIAVMLLSGCVSHRIAIAPITLPPIHLEITSTGNAKQPWLNALAEKFMMKAIGPESMTFQLAIGCEGYRRLTGRWPRTKEEIGEGLASEKLSADRLADLQQVNMKEAGDSLVVEFSSGGKIPMQGQINIHRQTNGSASRAADAPEVAP